MTTFVLHVDVPADGPGWRLAWRADGAPLGAERVVAGQAMAEVWSAAERFRQTFEQGLRPLVPPGVLREVGAALERAFWVPAIAKAPPVGVDEAHELVIESGADAALELPWELVESAPGRPIGCDPSWRIRRAPLPGDASSVACASAVATAPPALAEGPLRVVFLSAAPRGHDHLDYERDEARMLRSIESLLGDVVVHVAEQGTLEALAALVAEHRPHVIHLAGRVSAPASSTAAACDAWGGGPATFDFEDESGAPDPRDAATVMSRLAAPGSVRCVVLAACDTSPAAAAAWCAEAVRAGLPAALAWAARTDDALATRFASILYEHLAHGAGLARALAAVRERLRSSGQIQRGAGAAAPVVQDPSYAVAQLFAGAGDDRVFDCTIRAPLEAAPELSHEILGDGIQGVSHGFVGRRRELEELLPSLASGEHTVAVITGIVGAGTTTLATLAAQRLAQDGFHVVTVRVPESAGRGPAEVGRATLDHVVDALARAFAHARHADLHARLVDPAAPLAERLEAAIEGLNRLELVVVLDRFEEAARGRDRPRRRPGAGAVCRQLAQRLVRGSRVLVASRYRPVDLLGALHVPLIDFRDHEVRKFLLHDARVQARLHGGELPRDLFDRLCRELSGTPGHLEIARVVLGTVSAEELRGDLDAAESAELARAREAHLQRIFLERLWERLPASARVLVSRVAASELPLPVEAAARIATCSVVEAQRDLDTARALALVHAFPAPGRATLHHPPQLLLGWLREPVRLAVEDVRAVDRELAQFWKASVEARRERDLSACADAQLDACLHHARAGGEREVLRWAVITLARRLTANGEVASARDVITALPERERDSDVWLALADVEEALGEREAARRHLDLALSRAAPGSAVHARIEHRLARAELAAGHASVARERIAAALAEFRALADPAGELAALDTEGDVLLALDDRPAARSALEALRALGETGRDPACEARAWSRLATLDRRDGAATGAAAKLEKARAIQRVTRDRVGEARSWSALAELDLAACRHSAARTKLGNALSLVQALGDRGAEADAYRTLAAVDLAEGNFAAAREKLVKELSIRRLGGDRASEAGALLEIAEVAERMGNAAGAKLLGVLARVVDPSLPVDLSDTPAMIELARAGYERDRGADLVEAAFKVGGSVVAAAGATLSASPGAAPWSRVKSWFARR
ncbi:MAG: CHAT domain-containing protein [Deltaproteobacteria bacterium]|nr:CHAT domain-containing protein [Deltaproteobacteria bacterium]